MASWVFCNRCFQPPHRTSCFSLTSCGHVYCHVCLGKGGKDKCAICRAPCRTVPLSKHTDWDIQALFLRVDSLCARYSRDTAQISEFQEKHRRRLLAFYREKVWRLEDALRMSALQVQQLQSARAAPQVASGTVRTSVSTPSARPHGCPLLLLDAPASVRAEPMDVDSEPTPKRRPEGAAGPMRISLISPPQDGRMGSVCRPGSTPLPGPTPTRMAAATALRGVPPAHTPTPPPSLVGADPSPRPPISISGLRQRGGSGGHENKGWIVPVLGQLPGLAAAPAGPRGRRDACSQQAPNLRLVWHGDASRLGLAPQDAGGTALARLRWRSGTLNWAMKMGLAVGAAPGHGVGVEHGLKVRVAQEDWRL
ncbi:probable E3 SUMO-protein ligase RNF212 [Talpa occidentalis]|uniref:probable E3 SUMO-protein ligase RNF212 n=1 Tax=Talpa occidentalis TaxID=50954 RepID=UPI00188EC992|nr:probable E3 SUMO-protein ligase RNF212 [Talpa occidentalis]